MSVMYFLKPESRWNPGLDSYIYADNNPDSSGGSAVNSTNTSVASTPNHDSFEIVDEDMDLAIPSILESPQIVENLIALNEKIRQPMSNKISLVELEKILNGLNSIEPVRQQEVTNMITIDSEELEQERLNELFGVKSESDNQSDTVPVSSDSTVAADDEFFYSMINHTEKISPIADFYKYSDSFVEKRTFLENICESDVESYSLHHSKNVLNNLTQELDSYSLPSKNVINDFTLPLDLYVPSDIGATELTDEFILACQDDTIIDNIFSSNEEYPPFCSVPPRLINSQDYFFECENESPLLSDRKDPFIGQEINPKNEISIKTEPEECWESYKIYTSNSDATDSTLVKEMWSETDLIAYTHSYCKPVKIECRVGIPPIESLPNHDQRTELSVPTHNEKVVPVKRRPGRPRKNSAPPGAIPKITKSAPPKKKRSGPPPAKKTKLSSVCNEKRLQHNVLERNRRNTMRESMESVEHLLPERTLQLTQLALNTERAERSEEVENDFTNAVFRNVEDLQRRNYDAKNVKCRKINTKKGTRYPKMVVLLTATYYYLHELKDYKSKISVLKKGEHSFRPEVSRPSKKVKRF